MIIHTYFEQPLGLESHHLLCEFHGTFEKKMMHLQSSHPFAIVHNSSNIIALNISIAGNLKSVIIILAIPRQLVDKVYFWFCEANLSYNMLYLKTFDRLLSSF